MKMIGHVSKEQWESFYGQKMSKEEMVSFFTHISGCEFCADKMKDEVPKEAMLAAPNGLEDELLKKAGKPKKNKELAFYSFRVAFSIALSVLFLFILPSNQMDVRERWEERGPSERKEAYTDVLAKGLYEFSVKVSEGLNAVVERKDYKSR